MAKPIYSKFVQTSAGAADPSASFTVVNEETGLDVDIYSDRAGTTVITPPYFADSSGLIRFYYDEGITIRIAVTGASGSFTDRYQEGRVFGGEPGNSPRILDFQVDSISQLPPATGSGRKVSVTSYHDGTTVGGDEFIDFGPARHDGGRFIDPDRIAEFDTDAYYVDSGSDANCWKRVTDFELTPEDYGQQGDVFSNRTDTFFNKVRSDDKSTAIVGNISEKVNLANKRINPIFSAEQIKSAVDVDSFVSIGGGASILQVLRLSCYVDNTKDLRFIIDGDFSTDLIIGSSSTQFNVTCASTSDLIRTNPILKSSTVSYEGGKIIVTVASADLDQAAFAFDIRLDATAPITAHATIRSIKAFQNAKKVGDSLYNLVRPSNDWGGNGTRNTIFANECADYFSLDLNTSAVESSGCIDVSPRGGDSYLSAPYSLDFYESTIRTGDSVLVLPRVINFQDGIYRPYRKEFVITHSRDISLVSKGFGAKIQCSTRIEEVDFTLGGTAGGVSYYTASYDPDSHYNASVRSGSEQPKLSIELNDSYQESVGKYYLTEAANAAEVQSTPSKYYFDQGAGTLYVSYPDSFTKFPVAIHVCESASFIRTTTTINSLFGFNVHVSGCERNNWDIRPTNYVRYPINSSAKYISLHNCSGMCSAVDNGITIYNVDHEMIDCKFSYNNNDGFNHHEGGVSIVRGGEAISNKEDGISHHTSQKGYIEGLESKYNGAGNYTPAFGADIYHFNCVSVAGKDASNTKTYSGSFSALSSTAGNVKAVYDSCRSDLSLSTVSAPRHYVAVGFDTGFTTEMYIINPATSGTHQLVERYDTGTLKFDVK